MGDFGSEGDLGKVIVQGVWGCRRDPQPPTAVSRARSRSGSGERAKVIVQGVRGGGAGCRRDPQPPRRASKIQTKLWRKD